MRLTVCGVASKTQTTCKTKENRNNKHCQENIFVSIHEGLLMNGIFNKFHFFKREHDVCWLTVLSRQYILLYIEIQGITKDVWLHDYFFFVLIIFYNTGRTLTAHSFFTE